jgi:hypothetical protein
MKMGAQVLNDQGNSLGVDRMSVILIRSLGGQQWMHGHETLGQFDDCHFCIVAATVDRSQYARVSTLTLGIAGLSLFKQSVNKLLVVDKAHGLTTRRQRTIFGKRDHAIGFFAHGFSANFCSGNSAMPNQFSSQGTQQSAALVGGFPQLVDLATVTHSNSRNKTTKI